MLAGVGMALFFAPMASVVLGSVGRSHAGQASGANNAIRELGGVFGVAVLAAIFTARGRLWLGPDVHRRHHARPGSERRASAPEPRRRHPNAGAIAVEAAA